MSATPLTRPTRVTVDMAAMYAAAKESRNALLAYLADAGMALAELRSELAALEADAALAIADTALVEADMLRMNGAWAAADGITPPAPVVADAPAPVTPARPAPRLQTLGNRPTLLDCTRKMSNRTEQATGRMTANVHAPALCMLLASVHDVLAVAGDRSPADWAFGPESRPEADMAAKRRWDLAGCDPAAFLGFATACWELSRTKGEHTSPTDVLAAFMPGVDALDVAMATAPCFA